MALDNHFERMSVFLELAVDGSVSRGDYEEACNDMDHIEALLNTYAIRLQGTLHQRNTLDRAVRTLVRLWKEDADPSEVCGEATIKAISDWVKEEDNLDVPYLYQDS